MQDIDIVREADVERIWLEPEKEYSHRLVTNARQGSESLSFHLTTYQPGFTTQVEGDGVHEVVMFCVTGGATITLPSGKEESLDPGAAIYLPKEFTYGLRVWPEGMKLAVACNPPKE